MQKIEKEKIIWTKKILLRKKKIIFLILNIWQDNYKNINERKRTITKDIADRC